MSARAATEIKARNSSCGFVIFNAGSTRISYYFNMENEGFRDDRSLNHVRIIVLARRLPRTSSVAVRFIQDYVIMRHNSLRRRSHDRALSISFLELLLSLFLINLFFCLLERKRTRRRIRWTGERVSTRYYYCPD